MKPECPSCSSSESDISECSADGRLSVPRPQRVRKTSVNSVSTNPEEEAYVMVLQNKTGVFKDLKSLHSSKELCDVIFIVGEEKKQIYGVKSIISSQSKILHDTVQTYEQSRREFKNAKMINLKKTLSKLNKFKCASPNQQALTCGCDVIKKTKMPIETFDAETFQRLIVYIHCGTLTVDSRTVLGLLNASFLFGFPEVRQACWDFALGCTAREDNLQDLFESAKRYSAMEMTQEILETIRQYKDNNPVLMEHSDTLERLIESTHKFDSSHWRCRESRV